MSFQGHEAIIILSFCVSKMVTTAACVSIVPCIAPPSQFISDKQKASFCRLLGSQGGIVSPLHLFLGNLLFQFELLCNFVFVN